MSIIVITPPTDEALTLGEVKDYLRVSVTTDDQLIEDLIGEARTWAENLTGRALMPQTRELVLDAFPDSPAKIYCAPIQAISTFKYRDSTGAETTWLPATNYILDADHVPPRLSLGYGISWPSVTLYPVSGVRVRFTSGYSLGSAAITLQRTAVPQPLKKTMLRRIQWLYDHRDVAVTAGLRGRIDVSTPETVERALAQELNPYRLWRFA